MNLFHGTNVDFNHIDLLKSKPNKAKICVRILRKRTKIWQTCLKCHHYMRNKPRAESVIVVYE